MLVCAEGGRSAPLGGGAAHRIQWTAESASGAESKPTSKCSHAAAPLPQADPVLVCDSTGGAYPRQSIPCDRASHPAEHPARCGRRRVHLDPLVARRIDGQKLFARESDAAEKTSKSPSCKHPPGAQSQSDSVAASTGLLPLGPSPTWAESHCRPARSYA